MVNTPPPDQQAAAERAAAALLNTGKPLQKPRWHFGIRSRSPPMEVMLEIYKTLNVLGMQWRRKEGISMPDIGPPVSASEGYTEEVVGAMEQWSAETGVDCVMVKKAPPKKDTNAAEKAAQGLYLVETRARYGDIMVSLLD